MTTGSEASEFYTGFVADHYDLLVPDDEYGSYSFYADAIRDGGEPALELACGTGRPIIAFRAAGIEVEGVDSSPDMLARCRRKAHAAGVDLRLHQQRMESFDLASRFQTVFVVSSSFTLLESDDLVRESLATIHRHLLPGGRLLIALDVPRRAPPGPDWFPNREATRDDGALVRCRARVDRFDDDAQIFATTLRYQLLRDDQVEYEEDRLFVRHWHTQAQFRAHLEAAGFEDIRAVRGDWQPSQPDDPAFIFVARK